MQPEFRPDPEATGGLPNVVIGGCMTLARGMPDLEYVLAPVLVQGQLITLTAHPGHGKSTIGLGMSVSLALATVLGRLRPTAPGLVYYVSAEDLEGTRKRVFAEAVHRGLDQRQRDALDERLRWVQITGGIVSPPILREDIEDDAAGRPVLAVFLDTGPAMFAGESENDNVLMQSFATSCRVLTDLPGRPCVVAFWHPAKGATADSMTPRGGSALLGAVDGNLTVWQDIGSGIATLARSPWKWRGEHFEPMCFRFDTVDLTLPSGRPASVKVAVPVDGVPTHEPKPVRRDVALDALREVLGDLGEHMPGTSTIPKGVRAVKLTQWRDRWALRTGYADSTPDSVRNNFHKDKDALLKAGQVRISAPYVWLA